jgi:hypothetical protein
VSNVQPTTWAVSAPEDCAFAALRHRSQLPGFTLGLAQVIAETESVMPGMLEGSIQHYGRDIAEKAWRKPDAWEMP